MSTGQVQAVAFRYQLSDWTMFVVRRRLQVHAFGIGDGSTALDQLPPLQPGSGGMMLRALPLADAQPMATGISRVRLGGQDLLRYVLLCVPRYYIDMAQTFDAYKAKFSGKSRSTINRKVKKFAELGGGHIRWERFSRADELGRFWQLARQVAARTYQERLLDAGLPDDPAYFDAAKRLADADNLRAFLLFDGDRPVSYLFCPVHDGIIQYAYLGYDPDYLRMSAGTVLQWLAMESLFAEQRFRYFDFTEGESEHKRLFSTGSVTCANIALLKPSLGNLMLARSHFYFGRFVESLGDWLDEHDLKTRVRRWMRFGGAGQTGHSGG